MRKARAPDAENAAAAGPRVSLCVSRLTLRLPRGGERPYAVENVSFAVAPGEVLAVVGRSGSGKSLLASALIGLLARGVVREAGEILVDGEPITGVPERMLRRLRGRTVGAVFQDPASALNGVLTIGRQVGEGLERELSPAAVRRRVEQLLIEVGLAPPQRFAAALPSALSGGERQRATIAAALAQNPAVLVADEPTAMLDSVTAAAVIDRLATLARERRMALVLVTHDLGIVAAVAARVVVLDAGVVVEEGATAALLAAPRADATRRLVEAVPRGIAPPRPAPTSACLAVEHLAKMFGDGRRAVDDVSLGVGRGEVLGLVGISGSGKSTLARAVARLVEPDAGSITVGNRAWSTLAGAALRRQRRRVQMVFQDPGTSLDPRSSARTVVARAAAAAGASRRDARLRALELLAAVGIGANAARRLPAAFSGGERQRIAIARALATEPELLVADEAVSALDAATKAEIVALFARLRDERGLAILFITHDLALAGTLCDRIAVMHDGRIVETGRTARLFSTPAAMETRRLLAARRAASPSGRGEV